MDKWKDTGMKTIVFIGSNEFGTSREALTIAREMGYWVVLFTDKRKLMTLNLEISEVNQLVFMEKLMEEKEVIDRIEKLKIEGKQICACVSFIDPFVSYAVKIANQLCLAQISVDSLYLMEDKIKVREKLANLPITPSYAIFKNDDSLNEFVKKYKTFSPLIIKPPISNGSKDVLLVDTMDMFEEAIMLIQKKHSKSSILIEEFLIGPQYLIEIIVYNNEVRIVGVVEQEVMYNGRFIVNGYKFPAKVNANDYEKLYVSILSIIEQIGLTNGSCHIEMKLVQDEWKLIEINPRMSGGAMNRIIEEGTGINLVKEILKMYLGEEPTFTQTRQLYVYARYLTIGSRGRLLKVTGKELALMHDGVKYVYIKPLKGKILTSPYSMGNRYACIIAASESDEQAKAIALAAAKEIKFFLVPA
ncbi:ATP-grasp domain-containing protein [Psychrobacillus sp. NPDC058041]|uniref:ATP-grasp domain-containing protein n=1 Tax=Psychrobacillus sp. NPDC058041 TaxID=3346310 RepID=UPI0036DD5C85